MPKNKKISKKEVAKMLYNLSLAISETKKPEEAMILLRDLLSVNESKMIAKRLKIAEFLLDDYSYDQIREELGVGYSTISRVHEWLKISGDGYRIAIKRIKGKGINVNEETILTTTNITTIKKKYPMYYWPEIVLENIIKNSSKNQKNKLNKVLKEMDKAKEKTDLYKKLKRIIKN